MKNLKYLKQTRHKIYFTYFLLGTHFLYTRKNYDILNSFPRISQKYLVHHNTKIHFVILSRQKE